MEQIKIQSKDTKYTIVKYGDLTTHEDRLKWLQIREVNDTAIGGSDMGVIMGVNPYVSKPQLFDQKLGLTPNPDLSSNWAVYFGVMYEENVKRLAQYYDFENPTNTIENTYKDNKLRKIFDFNYTIWNDKYPWLIANPDGVSFKKDCTWETISPLIENFHQLPQNIEAVVECKTISGQQHSVWENGVPYGYILQCLHYCTVFTPLNEDIYAELYSQVDLKKIEGVKIYLDVELIEKIITESYHFHKLLEQGKSIIKNSKNEEQMKIGLDEIRPDVNETDNCAKHYNQNYLEKIDPANRMVGDEDFLKLVEEYDSYKKEIKPINKNLKLIQNKIRQYMQKKEVRIVELPDDKGKVSFNRRLYVTYKNGR